MSRFLRLLFLAIFSLFISASPAKAAPGYTQYQSGAIGIAITGCYGNAQTGLSSCGEEVSQRTAMNLGKFLSGEADANGHIAGLLPTAGSYLAMMYQDQPSSREYIADLLDNIGIPSVSSAYAQGTGYQALNPFLEFWRGFRNLAYSLYIIMFVVVGVMIMLRTKVNAQTVITIQSALPNLVITLILITFSYAIVGFMIDLMYFLIYALVYLLAAANIISTPTDTISRLLNYNAWSVVFEGRNSIISGIALALKEILVGSTAITQIIDNATGVGIFANGLAYVVVAVWIAIAMLKLIWVLLKSYVMLIVQTVTAPLQLLMNAMPGSQAFSSWLKRTASYLLPFPVAAAMFVMAAVFIGDPTSSTLMGDFWIGTANPFGINSGHSFYQQWNSNQVWLPPFTLTGTNWQTPDLMAIIGLFIFTMTPAAVKMTQEWLQVKESPYTSEITAGLGSAIGLGKLPWSYGQNIKRQQEQRNLAREQARWNAEEFKNVMGS